MPGVNYSAVRREVPMAAVLRALGFEARHARGEQLRGPCPVHGSCAGSRSFSVNLRLGRYRCFACGSQGNALELWAAVRRINVHAAAIELCQMMGVEGPWITRW